ncbi:TPA: hypothetical protein QCY24_004836 [Bacillus wiedmannii]|nr:hypothetical protein [Bacillus wiedmannii]HDR7871086.1 hypothetical protein [Bacillus wiedmannii]HDR7963510.1 hypothetical protein [Bacillus wiedmannii]
MTGKGASQSGALVNSIEVYSETFSPTWRFDSDGE